MTPEEYLDRVRSLLPALRERAVHAEQLRRLPDETFKDFQALGLFRCIQPRRYEGYELDPGTFYQAIMEVGAVCGSSAWCLGVVGVHNWHLALFPPQAQEDVWGRDTSVQLSTSLAPTGYGRARRRRLSPARPLVVLEHVRPLPVGRGGRRGAAGARGRPARRADVSPAARATTPSRTTGM